MFKALRKKKADKAGGSTVKSQAPTPVVNGQKSGNSTPNGTHTNQRATETAVQDNGGSHRPEETKRKPQSLDSLQREPVEESPAVGLPDFLTDANAVLEDTVPWRYGETPDYTAANTAFLKERTNMWPPGSLEDLVSNLVKNWEKEASYKVRLTDWRTINTHNYKFSCNGGREYTANEMMQIGTYNALIQEAAFYSAKHTSFEESHAVFRRAMPDGFAWEVTDVYSGPPVVAFKWRHWGKMTGKLVCPLGPDTKLEADPTNQEVEIYGVCVACLDADFKINRLQVFYDPHELMASLVDARNLSYKSPAADEPYRKSLDMRGLTTMMDTMRTGDDFRPIQEEGFSDKDGERSLMSRDSLASELPSDATLLSALSDKPAKMLPGSRCPFPHN